MKVGVRGDRGKKMGRGLMVLQDLERHMTMVGLITYDSQLLYTIQFPGACIKSPNMKITIVLF